MPSTDLELFDDSLSRCYAKPEFLDRFYELFLAASPEARAKFAGTDMARQRRMLKASLVLMMVSADGKSEGTVHMERIAGVHSNTGFDISAALYDVWLNSLLQAVSEFDPRCNEALLQTWRRVLEPGIAFMKSRHNARPQSS